MGPHFIGINWLSPTAKFTICWSQLKNVLLQNAASKYIQSRIYDHIWIHMASTKWCVQESLGDYLFMPADPQGLFVGNLLVEETRALESAYHFVVNPLWTTHISLALCSLFGTVQTKSKLWHAFISVTSVALLSHMVHSARARQKDLLGIDQRHPGLTQVFWCLRLKAPYQDHCHSSS